jgi:hypothetical protein
LPEKNSAHIAGDIAMLEEEVNTVIRALRANNLEVVALHNHMFGENPRIIFLHYYGRGPAATLARDSGRHSMYLENPLKGGIQHTEESTLRLE